jgi:diadenosine tetraphosphate (Ap4A) HIT family hydrolase
MSKRSISVHVFMRYDYSDDWTGKEWRPDIWHCKVDENAERVYIGKQTIDVDIPDDFDPVPKQVAALEDEKLKALAQYTKTVADINERLSKLLAIEYTA